MIRAPLTWRRWPVLPETQYEQALGVLRNARNALERTPSMTANLDEEKIRDLLRLAFLPFALQDTQDQQ